VPISGYQKISGVTLLSPQPNRFLAFNKMVENRLQETREFLCLEPAAYFLGVREIRILVSRSLLSFDSSEAEHYADVARGEILRISTSVYN